MVTPAKQASRPAKNAAKKAVSKSNSRPPLKAVKSAPPKVKEPKPVKHCLHGCGQVTKGGDFVIGHDAKLKSILQKAHVAGDKTVDLGDSPLSGQAPMAIAKARGWQGFLDKAKAAADEKANRPKRTARTKVKGGPVEVGNTVEFNYRGSKRSGKVIETSGDRSRVEYVIDGKPETRAFSNESLAVVSGG